jgi:hypothetical protein
MNNYENDFIEELFTRIRRGTPIGDIVSSLQQQMSFYSHQFVAEQDENDRQKYFIVQKYLVLLSKGD